MPPSTSAAPVDFSKLQMVNIATPIKTATFQLNSQLSDQKQDAALLPAIGTALEDFFGAPAYTLSGGDPIKGTGGHVPRGFMDQVTAAIKGSQLPGSKQVAPVAGFLAGFMEPLGGFGKLKSAGTLVKDITTMGKQSPVLFEHIGSFLKGAETSDLHAQQLLWDNYKPLLAKLGVNHLSPDQTIQVLNKVMAKDTGQAVGKLPLTAENPYMTLAKANPDLTVEQIVEKSGGWKPGDRVRFDTALMHKDAATIKSMLPDVPKEYQTRFSKLIGEVTQPRKPNGRFDVNPQRGAIKNPFYKGEGKGGEPRPPEEPVSGSSDNATTGKPGSGGKTDLTSGAPGQTKGLQAGTGARLPQGESSFANSTLNLKNLNISKDAKALAERAVTEVKPAIQKLVGKTLSNRETATFASQTSKMLTRSVGRDDTLAWQASLLKARQALSDAAKSGTIDESFIKNLLVVKTHGTDIARKLQSMSIGADAIPASVKQAILEGVLKVNSNTEDILKAAQGVNFNDLKQATDFYRKFIKPTAGEWLDLVRYNSMLSSPKTHIVNTVSNFFNTGLIAPIEKTLTGGLDFLGSSLSGAPRSAFAGEGAVYAAKAITGLKDAVFRFSDVMTGRRVYTNLDTRNIPIAASGIKGGVVNALSFPMRLLEGMDQFFTAIAEAGQTGALKYRASKGIAVGNIEEAAQHDAAYRLYRQKPMAEQEGHLLNAIDQFTVKIQGLRNNENPIVSIVAKFTVPFLQTPMNIFKQGAEYSPVGFGTLWGAANKTEQLSKAIIGSSIFAGAGTLLASNRLTWGEPTIAADKANFRAAGMQAYSVKIGNRWYSYQKLPPGVAFPLAMVAAIHDTQANKKITDNTVDLVLTGIAKYGQFLSDQSYAKSIGDILAAAKGGEAGIAHIISNYGQQLVPLRALGGWLAHLTDPTQRKIDSSASFVDQQVQLLMMNIPGLSEKVPARLDSGGKPIPQQFPVANAFSPVTVTEQSPAQAKDYQSQQMISQMGKQNTAASKALHDQASQDLAALRKLSTSAEKKAYFTNIAKTDPDLAKKVIELAKQPTGLSATEAKLLNASTATRAQFIAGQLKGLNTNAEKRALIQGYVNKKIVTKAVLTELAPLLK